MQYEKVGEALLLLAFIFIFINDQCSLIDHFKGSVLLIMYNKSFMVGYHYAEKALIERLEQRETDTRNLDIIVYINRLSEEKIIRFNKLHKF